MVRITVIKAILRIFCAVSLLSLGFGHQPVQALSQISPGAEYRLPDGTFPTLCIGNEAGHVFHDIPAAGVPPCEVCRLAASMLLAGSTGDGAPAYLGIWLFNSLPFIATVMLVRDLLLPHARAPPPASLADFS